MFLYRERHLPREGQMAVYLPPLELPSSLNIVSSLLVLSNRLCFLHQQSRFEKYKIQHGKSDEHSFHSSGVPSLGRHLRRVLQVELATSVTDNQTHSLADLQARECSPERPPRCASQCRGTGRRDRRGDWLTGSSHPSSLPTRYSDHARLNCTFL
ncbi:hypothetical protein SCHPADRAFT_762230 [Schizopora paradoxa]|uniref:Uncharacterized protein n=1 Tax=Schizopora paradoxa TaxID=27342 RepID=A0A0H2QXK3_9AGAM|nr:hypothetical protein SCHPADRAFT_762230 [Schizopora paradoxa]